MARGQTEFDDDVDVDVAGIGQIDRRFPLSLSETLIVTLPCIIPFVDGCEMLHGRLAHMRKWEKEALKTPEYPSSGSSCVIKGRGRQ